MLQARVSLHHALEVLVQQTTKPAMKGMIQALESEVRKGNSFDKALGKFPKVFEQLFVVTAEVGQESGRLAEVLVELSTHLEKMSALKKKFLQAMTYPALVVAVAVASVGFLLMFIVPGFAEMFRSFQMELPFSTRIILLLSGALARYGLLLIVAIAVAAYFTRGFLKIPSFRKRLDDWSLRLPLFGDIVLKTHVARFCRTLGTLLQAQVSLVDALAVSERIASTDGIRSEIRAITRHVREGRAIAEPLKGSELFPPMVVQMIAVGEETSELDQMLLKVADYYEKEIDGKLDALSSVMEPLIMLFLGFIVASILISMYLPMFDLVNAVSGTGN
jgi:type IV pilus assembly protein PilC